MADQRRRSWIIPIILLLGALSGSTLGYAAPPVTSRATYGPVRSKAGGINLTLRQVDLRRTATVALDVPGKVERQLQLRLEFRLSAPSAPDVEAVLRGEVHPAPRFRVLDDRGGESRNVLAEVVEVDDVPLLRLTVAGLSPDATALRLVEGELTAYPEVRRVRFHLPWNKDDVPSSVEYQGARATLQRFQLIEDDSTLWVSVRPPEGFAVALFATPGAVSARAVDLYGNLVNGGGITQIDQTRSGEEPEFRFQATSLRQTPSRLVLDVLCTSGQPRSLPFTLRNVPLVRR